MCDINFEKAYAYGCIYPGKESYPYVSPLINKISDYSTFLKDNATYSKASILLSYFNYSLGVYSEKDKDKYFKAGHKVISETLKENKDTTEFALMAWRCLALNSIYLNNQESFTLASHNINKIIELNDDNPNLCFNVWALTSLARGESHFKSPNFEYTLDRVEKIDNDIPWKDPLRMCAMLRNKVEIYDIIGKSNKFHKAKMAKRGLSISKENNYLRYVKYFERYLNN